MNKENTIQLILITIALILVLLPSANATTIYTDNSFENFTWAGLTNEKRLDNISSGNGTVRHGTGSVLHDGTPAIFYLQFTDDKETIDDGNSSFTWNDVGTITYQERGAFGLDGIRPSTDGGPEIAGGGYTLAEPWSFACWVGPSYQGAGSMSQGFDGPIFMGTVGGGAGNTYFQINSGAGGDGVDTKQGVPMVANRQELMSFQVGASSSEFFKQDISMGTLSNTDQIDLTAFEISQRGGSDGYNGNFSECWLFGKDLTSVDRQHLMGNITGAASNSSTIDFGSTQTWTVIEQNFSLDTSNMEARFCSYSNAGGTADESCSSWSNATEIDISAVTARQYAKYQIRAGNGINGEVPWQSTTHLTHYSINVSIASNYSITATDIYNGSDIEILNVTIAGTTYYSTTGEIITNIPNQNNTIQNIIYNAAGGYLARNYSNVNLSSGSHAGELGKTEVHFTTQAILTNTSINNFTIQSNSQSITTGNGTANLLTTNGSIEWNITVLNHNNITTLINLTHELDYTSRNHFDTQVNLYSNLSTNLLISGSCYLNTTVTTGTEHRWSLSTLGDDNMTCVATGYENLTKTLPHNYPQNISYREMSPVQLHLIFDQAVEGYIATVDNGTYFNTTQVLIPQTNISFGYVDVYLNSDGAGGWRQLYAYYNDNNTAIKEYIHIHTPDLSQEIKVTSTDGDVEEARVCAYLLTENVDTNVTQWTVTYCDYTNDIGTTQLLILDENEYKLCVQAEGYDPMCQLRFIPPANTDTIILVIESQSSVTNQDLMATNCQLNMSVARNCTWQVTTHTPYNTICFDYTVNGTTYSQCSGTSVQEYLLYEFDNETSPMNLLISLDGILRWNYTYTWNPANLTADIGWNIVNNRTGVSLMDRIDTAEYRTLFYILMLLFVGLFGLLTEKYYNGYGLLGMAVASLFLGVTGIWVFYLIAVPILLFLLNRMISPLLTK